MSIFWYGLKDKKSVRLCTYIRIRDPWRDNMQNWMLGTELGTWEQEDFSFYPPFCGPWISSQGNASPIQKVNR